MIRILIVTILFFAALESSFANYVPKAFSASFEQQKKLMMNRGVAKTSISIKYEFPGNIYMHSVGVDEDVYYICNPSKVWIYNPPFIEGYKGRVEIGNSSRHCLSKIFDKLKHGLVSNKEYKVEKLNDKTYLLNFSKKNEDKLGYYKFELVFSNPEAKFNQLKLMRMYVRNDKNPTVLLKKKFKQVKGFKSSTFNFTPPKNTTVDYM